MFNKSPPPKIVIFLKDNMECAGQATGDNMAHAYFMLDT
jgi:hypothetical protein